ncbi:MAG: GNAT family N-acetyltransferase, partial [Mycobacterium sp.]
KELAKSIGETVTLSVPDGKQTFCLDEVPGNHHLQTQNWVNRHYPLHLTSDGKLILATWTADELDAYLVAAIDMFIGEVGIDPRGGDGGRGYRRRVAGLIAAGRAWARFEHGQVVFKAEVGSQSPAVGQIQGVWVHPEWRGRGIGTAGTATLTGAVIGSGRIASLYVNSFNAVARATYARIGFSEVGTFATVLLD